MLCSIVGGYGRESLDDSVLSEESRIRAARDGRCLTLAEVPSVDVSSGLTYMEVVKIFHPPVLHPREKPGKSTDHLILKSHK